MLSDDSRQRAQRLIHLAGVWERGGHVGLQYDYNAPHSVPGCIFVGRGATEIVLGEDFVGIGRGGDFAPIA